MPVQIVGGAGGNMLTVNANGSMDVALPGGSVSNAAAVVPNDAANLANQSIALYVGVTGDVRVTLSGGTTITMTGLGGGMWHPIRATRVFATGTTATSMLYAY